MKDADLIQALKRIKVQTGGLICLGCGHEHNCGVHGCAVIREAAQRLEERMEKGTLELGEPLTQADISQLGYEKIWIEYKDGTGEWALVYAGKIYAIDALEGAGFGDILQDAMQGERLDWPTGQYTAYRRKKEHIDREAWEKPCSVCGGKTTLYQQTNTTKLFMSTFGKKATLVTECMACPPYADCCMKDISVNSAFKIKFCPECGRPLTEEARAELEKRLRGCMK